MKRCFSTCAVVLGVSTAFLQAGEVVTVNFTGVVGPFVRDDLNIFPGVSVGDPVSGTYSYDTNAPDVNPDPQLGSYPGAGTLTVEIGSFTFQSVTGQSLTQNDQPFDRFVVLDNNFTPSFPGTTSGRDLRVEFFDNEGGALSSDALPTGVPDLSEFEQHTGFVLYNGPSGPLAQSVIRFDITSVSLKPPDIPTVSQWGIAVMALLLLIGGRVYFNRRRGEQSALGRRTRRSRLPDQHLRRHVRT